MKKLSRFFNILAFVLTHVCTFVVAYNYRGLICGIEHAGFSAPAYIAFFYAIPFCAGIALCLILAAIFRKKSLGAAQQEQPAEGCNRTESRKDV